MLGDRHQLHVGEAEFTHVVGHEVREFADQLTRRFGLPIHWIDERMTSVLAERAVRGIGLKRSEREDKGRIDAAAAALILEGHLARLRNRSDAADEA